MSKRQIDVLSSFFLLIIAAVVAFGIYQIVRVDRAIEKIHEEDAQRVIGTDEKLAKSVRDLELKLKNRLEYQFESPIDPFDLTRTITSPKVLEKLGLGNLEKHRGEMRLAATVVGSDGVAAILIRYMGSNHVLRVGEKIAGYTVSEINQRQALLRRGGEKLVLVNEKSTAEFVDDVNSVDLSVPFVPPTSGGNY